MNYIDNELNTLIDGESNRQENTIELIASENFTSKEVRKAQGSVLTNKYAEGYPGKRYYGGNYYIDKIENLAIERLNKIFGSEYANVQPHSGSQANNAAYLSLIDKGDKVMGMGLNAGGHLTHGASVNFSGKDYEFREYGLDPETETLNYDSILETAKEFKPKLIVAGASAYSRIIDFDRFRNIADEVGAFLMVDMAHIAGLVASGLHPSPIGIADIVTSTTHKTLRGPRGGFILSSNEYSKKINSAIFPGTQGGPLEHVIAAKAQAFYEVLQDDFKKYSKEIINNSKAMAEVVENDPLFRVVSGGTDNHLFTIDLTKTDLTGKQAQNLLEKVFITVNKEALPNEKRSPFITSGIRVGTPAITTKKYSENDSKEVAYLMLEALKNSDNEIKLKEINKKVVDLAKKHPFN